MPNFVSSVLLLLFSASAYSVAAQTYIVDLNKQPIALEASGQYRVTRIIDARPDRTRLGTVYQGLDNTLTSADFAAPLEAALLPPVQRTQPNGNARPVSMRFHVLSIGEDIRSTAETGTVELMVDFLEKRGDTYAVLATHAETLESSGLDVTSKHAGLLSQGLQHSLLTLATVPANASAVGALLTEAEVLNGQGGLMALRYPIQTEPPRRGIYQTFAEFQANQPGINQEPFVLTHRTRTGKQWAGADDVDAHYLYMSPDKPERPVRNVWGMCDGEKLYIWHRGNFFELRPQGQSYTFTGVTPANSSDVATAAVVGGLVGGALAGAISGGQPRPYELHLATGRVLATAASVTVDKDGFARADTAAIYLYRRPDAAPTQALTVLVNGKEAGTLLPNSYLALSWNDRRRQIELCAQGTQQACHSFVPDFSVATYLECTIPTAVDAAPAFKKVIPKEGIFYVKKFRNRLGRR
ncbi:hypothetical protein [Hymenobacter cellulosivorans]|uniref:Uncharacterized protein n=1 Tax=Hymenobacter cellulosivorans TaxID=2932249 RepID=A0ABY4FFC8_9BACT|nr:hypothetical protein [Hymenobacter cellulosivorans]UOQ55324.1 hypothetical protein MUN80_11345 [Hymenobacter cellulosivorans]